MLLRAKYQCTLVLCSIKAKVKTSLVLLLASDSLEYKCLVLIQVLKSTLLGNGNAI